MRRLDKPLLVTIAVLLVAGALLFVSAALGLLARGEAHVSGAVFNHLVLGVCLGLVTLAACATIPYRHFKTIAPYLYGASLLGVALVFVPGVGFEHGGGLRWIDLGFATVQPSEALKIATCIMLAYTFAWLRERLATWRGLAAFVSVLAPGSLLLVLQPDIGTLGVIVLAAVAIFVVAGARARDIGMLILAGLICLSVLTYMRPYMLDRVTTFLNPSENPLAEGYQIRQSLLAVGSGGLFGRGFGQSVQKFTYLPEPMGDSIFAVAAEETGFVGSVVLILLFLILGLRGFYASARAPDLFGSLLGVGISAYLVGEAFINIASMLSLAPLTGIPLTFMSQGGSAMLVSLASAGILLNISRARR